MQCCSTILHYSCILRYMLLYSALLLSNFFLGLTSLLQTSLHACEYCSTFFRCVELLSNSLLTFPSQNFLICLWLPLDFLWSSCCHLDVSSAHLLLNYSIKVISQYMQLQTLQIYLCLIITQKAFSILYDSLLFEIYVTRRTPCHTKKGLNDFHLASFYASSVLNCLLLLLLMIILILFRRTYCLG